jgi:hypothetical protein
MKTVKKITTGFVIQSFNADTGKCFSQEFICGDEVDYEDEVGEPFDIECLQLELEYQPFDMVQPTL